ncbi:hypothetical protein [Prevotella sp.]|uniref:hypothetical protein n=1 Tax=uncultured Prevotella sp. TaxID=159272 RepID=UPI0027E22FEC|nr:hypothetical protein [uncultured Prevotella sp.]
METFFICYSIIGLIIIIANCFSSVFSGERESEEQMRMRYKIKEEQTLREFERLMEERERLKKLK